MLRAPASLAPLFASLVALAAAPAATACSATIPQRVNPVEPPAVYPGRVLHASGPVATEAGAECSVEVWRTDSEILTCRIRIRCGGDTVYGLPGAGYNRCLFREDEPVYAEDPFGTRRDGDPRLLFDRIAGSVTIIDDNPRVVVEVDLSGVPEAYRRYDPGPTP